MYGSGHKRIYEGAGLNFGVNKIVGKCFLNSFLNKTFMMYKTKDYMRSNFILPLEWMDKQRCEVHGGV